MVGVVVAAAYWSILRGVLPSDPHIGWQAHLFWLIGGIVAAMVVRRRVVRASSQRAGSSPSASGADPGPRGALHQELHDLGLD